ncbi:MAG TPA: gamma-glutamyltransferase family protein [Chloroflexota bacterium]|nr:gamma-glutamyltransferase family protein [Chloroflexota bacterium]
MNPRVTLRTWRPLVMGRRGAVVANHPLAAEAGLAILRKGGNAVDAYIATSSAIGVLEPHMSGIGGEGFALVYIADEGKAEVVNASGRAPRRATRDQFPHGLPAYGPSTVITPALVAGWCALHARRGSLPLGELLESAVTYARDGFAATQTFVRYAGEQADALAANPEAAEVFLPGGSPPVVGSVIRQAGLARTLEAIGAGGWDAFYTGDSARALAAWMREHGGLLDETDLRECRAEWQEPISVPYRGLEVLEAPPNSTGVTFLQELKLAEKFDLRSLCPGGRLPCDSPDLVHLLVEIKKLCFLDRERVADVGDPAALSAQLLADTRVAELAGQIDLRRALACAVPADMAPSDTTYLAVVDAAGNAVSGIQSLSDAFGADVVAGDTGILLNNRMRLWHLSESHPNTLKPGRRVRHTLNPPMALRDGRPYLVFGTPGFDAQLQVNLQTLTGIVDFDLDPQQAVEMPRWQHLQPGTLATWPHACPDEIVVEAGIPEETRRELQRRGHTVRVVGPLEGPGAVSALRFDPGSGFWHAGADPRRDNYALAW